MEKLHGTMSTLEAQMMTIENANVNLEALQVLKVGSAAMKRIQGTMYVPKMVFTGFCIACTIGA